MSFGDLWPRLSKVNSFTLCLRLLKSWTPRELELGGVVSWAAICWLLSLASFRSFSVKLVLRPKAPAAVCGPRAPGRRRLGSPGYVHA